MWGEILALLHYALALLVAGRVLLRRRMTASARLAWIFLVSSLPIIGPIIYLMFGEVRMRRADRQRMADVRLALSNMKTPAPEALRLVDGPAAPVVAAGRFTGGMSAVAGNRLVLLEEDDRAIDRLVTAIDAAEHAVHIMFYIWLNDRSGTNVAEAVVRAANRGVDCRVIVDAIGSRRLVRSDLWGRMAAAGAECVRAFPVRNPLMAVIRRLDLRNHRKIVVIDNRLGFTGSRNCADKAFAIKARYAPWIDIWISLQGPIVRQLQTTFLQDWMSYTGRDLGDLLEMVPAVADPGQAAQVIASGPDHAHGSLSDTMATLIHAARARIVITTPYYVPDEATDAAIRAASRRGVDVTMILPERNDSRIVAATSEGFYHGLLQAGVRLMLFQGGLIHAKIITVDGVMAMAGSANLDRRSFELNYEVNLLAIDADFTADLDARQVSYMDRARRLTLAEVDGWSRFRRVRSNMLALAAPLL